jgi:hypothetical protein
MKTNSILILALVLIVVFVLFNNNKQESFDSEGIVEYKADIENIVNELEVFLCLLISCPHCQKFKDLSDEEIKGELGIPGNIKVTKVLHTGAGDTASQEIFTHFGVNSAPTAVIHHKSSGYHEKTHASKEALAQTAGKVVEKIKGYFYKTQ